MATEISQLWDIDSGEYMVKIVCTENLNPPYPNDFWLYYFLMYKLENYVLSVERSADLMKFHLTNVYQDIQLL